MSTPTSSSRTVLPAFRPSPAREDNVGTPTSSSRISIKEPSAEALSLYAFPYSKRWRLQRLNLVPPCRTAARVGAKSGFSGATLLNRCEGGSEKRLQRHHPVDQMRGWERKAASTAPPCRPDVRVGPKCALNGTTLSTRCEGGSEKAASTAPPCKADARVGPKRRPQNR